jgi:TPP-dependent pyruvate/acetoin dehydrogenase alpha subunit
MKLSNEQLVELYQWMLWDRLLDQKANEIFRMGKLMSMYHSSQGQEAVNMGTLYALSKEDVFLPFHRGKASYVLRGLDLKFFMAGLYGKKEGFCQGRTPVGSHMGGDLSIGLLPTQGMIGSNFTFGVGAAMAFKLQKKPNAVMIPLGDGGSNRGDVHEGFNFAAVFKLPVVVMLSNNSWSISVPASSAVSVEQISVRASGYGIPGVTIDGRDVLKVYETVSEALERARNGEGPSLIEATVDRWGGHSANDPDIYRTDEDRAEARKIDPIIEYEKVLEGKKLLDDKKKKQFRDEITAEINEAVAYAESCTEPDFEDLIYGVYKEAS